MQSQQCLSQEESLRSLSPLVRTSAFARMEVKVQGIGFILGEREARGILAKHPEYQERLVRYIVGDDINNHPDQLSDRWVINFWDMNKEQCVAYPELWSILVERVKPYRDKLTKQVHEPCFWKFWDRREEFFDRVRAKGTVLVCSKLSKYLNLTFANPSNIYSEKVKVFDFSSYTAFAVLQSSFHAIWALTWGSTTGETPAYVGSTCFDTFPFPNCLVAQGGRLLSDVETPHLRKIGKRLFDHRSKAIKSRNVGLTAIYNLFHDPLVADEDIALIRDLHVELDAAIADAYQWSDLDLSRSFVERSRASEGDKWRFQVSEHAWREMIDRLIALNSDRSTAGSGLLFAGAGR